MKQWITEGFEGFSRGSFGNGGQNLYVSKKGVLQRIFQFDLVAWLFGGQGSLFSRIVYTLVGLAGLWCISLLFRRKVFTEGE